MIALLYNVDLGRLDTESIGNLKKKLSKQQYQNLIERTTIIYLTKMKLMSYYIEIFNVLQTYTMGSVNLFTYKFNEHFD